MGFKQKKSKSLSVNATLDSNWNSNYVICVQ